MDEVGHHNSFDGEADMVFQARDVQNVHNNWMTPVRAVPPPHQVPAPRPHCYGHERQMREVTQYADTGDASPVIAVIRGEPGSGRSTFCHRWVHEHRDRFPDGDYLVTLGGQDVTGVLAGLLESVGYDSERLPAGLEARSAMWRSRSHGKRLALVIDDALTADEVEALLPGAGGSVVLVVEAGRVARLVAQHAARMVLLTPLSTEAVYAMLAEQIGVTRIAAEPDAAAEFVRICDGSVGALTVLGTTFADFPDRSLRRLVRWLETHTDLLTLRHEVAYGRFTEDAQACYRVLGAHTGDGDVAVKTLAIVLGMSEESAQEAVECLQRAGLVRESREGRVLMTGLAARHACSKAGGVWRPLVAFYATRGLAAAERVLPRGWAAQLWSGRGADMVELTAAEALEWLIVEHHNLVAASDVAFRAEWHEEVCRLALAMWPMRLRGARPAEMALVSEHAAVAAREWSSKLAMAVTGMQQGFSAMQLRNWPLATELFLKAAEDAKSAGSDQAYASAVESLGLALVEQGRMTEAVVFLKENLELAERLSDSRRLALARFHLAKVSSPALAFKLLDSAADGLGHEPGNRVKITLWRGKKAIEAGELDTAMSALIEVSALAVGDWHSERIAASWAMAEVAWLRGDVVAARAHAQDALSVCVLRGFEAEAEEIRRWLATLP
ncbi:ATP-binding protein [Amycolatopsis sp. NBC_00345]|uniref:ATP-binding protein n=1 Tax=Amycolatopsis sp. NBC_00345 TaxID=2975955 RepID=UPI002E26C8F9